MDADGQICFVTRLHSREKALKILQLSSKFVTVEHGVVKDLTQWQTLLSKLHL